MGAGRGKKEWKPNQYLLHNFIDLMKLITFAGDCCHLCTMYIVRCLGDGDPSIHYIPDTRPEVV